METQNIENKIVNLNDPNPLSCNQHLEHLLQHSSLTSAQESHKLQPKMAFVEPFQLWNYFHNLNHFFNNICSLFIFVLAASLWFKYIVLKISWSSRSGTMVLLVDAISIRILWLGWIMKKKQWWRAQPRCMRLSNFSQEYAAYVIDGRKVVGIDCWRIFWERGRWQRRWFTNEGDVLHWVKKMLD